MMPPNAGVALDTQRVAYETARLRLARYRLEGTQARSRAAAHATQVSAEALGVERVGVWLWQDGGQHLVCASQYSRSRRVHSSGHALLAKDCPAYLDALSRHRVIAATDALTYPATRELAHSYLQPGGTVSLLCATIIREGRAVGVVCHEHVGAPRTWTEKELDFASTVADIVTLIFEQADRLELEAALQEQSEQRQESQKMEALGRMASSVAHDFNNLLAMVVFAIAELADAKPEERSGLARELEQAIEVGKSLTQQLLTFGKERSEPGVQPADWKAALERLLPMLRAAVGGGISLETALSARAPVVACDASQLDQIVMNLTLNARDAVAETGHITITLRDSTPDDEVAPDSVVLEVRDDGAGMDESTRVRVFEPFFTTKRSGTGLGLATVYGIVRRCGGVARVHSEPGGGTTMFIALPRAAVR